MDSDLSKMLAIMESPGEGEPSKDNQVLNKILKLHDPSESALIFASIILNPNYQSTIGTLEKVIHMCLGLCKGNKKPTRDYTKKVFQEVSSSGIGMMDDPAEDVFMSQLWLNKKNYKVLPGLWEGSIHQTQIFLNALEKIPKDSSFIKLYEQIQAVLMASDDVLSKFDIPVNKITGESPLRRVASKDIKGIEEVSILFNVAHLNHSDKLPILPKEEWGGLSSAELGNSALEEKPFISIKNQIYLILPTAITTSIRRLIFNYFDSRGELEFLVGKLALIAAEKLNKLNLLGKFNNAPVVFQKIKKLDNLLVARILIEFDTGYYYNFIFLLDTLVDFGKKWFSGFVETGKNVNTFLNFELRVLTKEIYKKNPDSKICSFIVPIGFGRGILLPFTPEKDDWLIEVIYDNDLITLSQDVDCNPFKIWRLIEAQSLANKYGARIFNINGFLNLYGYTKENDFSLINHSDFLDSESKNVLIMIDTNHQKNVREKVLQDVNLKTVSHPESGTKIVRRGFANSLFKHNDVYDIYCAVTLEANLFQAVLSNNSVDIWVEMNVNESIEISLQLQIFDAYIHWFSKVVEILSSLNVNINSIDLIKLDIDIPSNYKNVGPKLSEANVLNSSSYSLDDKILECNFSENLFYGFSLATNIAEKALMKPFIEKNV